MRIKEHLMALSRISHQEECTTGTQLHMPHLHLMKHATDQHAFLTPVKLERLTILEGQWHKGSAIPSLSLTRDPNKIRHPAVATFVALGLDLMK